MIEVMKTGKNIILFCLLWSHVAVCLPIAEGTVNERHVLAFSAQKDGIIEQPPTQNALGLINRALIYRVRTKFDRASSGPASGMFKDKEGLALQQPTVTNAGSTNAVGMMTSVLNKRADDVTKQARSSIDQNTMSLPSSEHVLYIEAPPVVTVRSAFFSRPDAATVSVEVPLVPYMSVFRALIYAAGNFKKINKDVEDKLNPFNASLAWNNLMSCYEIVELLGQKNHGHEYWELAVFSEDHEIKYQDKCLPFEGELVLRPHDEVLIFHL